MGPDQSEMEHEGHSHLEISSLLGKSACFVLDTSEANLVGDESLGLYAIGSFLRSRDGEVESCTNR